MWLVVLSEVSVNYPRRKEKEEGRALEYWNGYWGSDMCCGMLERLPPMNHDVGIPIFTPMDPIRSSGLRGKKKNRHWATSSATHDWPPCVGASKLREGSTHTRQPLVGWRLFGTRKSLRAITDDLERMNEKSLSHATISHATLGKSLKSLAIMAHAHPLLKFIAPSRFYQFPWCPETLPGGRHQNLSPGIETWCSWIL